MMSSADEQSMPDESRFCLHETDSRLSLSRIFDGEPDPLHLKMLSRSKPGIPFAP
jgi:hypothetical protein